MSAVPAADLKTCLPPVTDRATRVLVLGSLPGEVSLLRGHYYGHPRNLFWPLIGEVIGRDLVGLAYDEKLGALRQAGVGLWDVVGSARRTGSLDAAIRDARPNDLARLVGDLPQVLAIGFNGGASARIGRREARLAGLDLLDLPSSSPAFASMSFAAKRERWRELARYL